MNRNSTDQNQWLIKGSLLCLLVCIWVVSGYSLADGNISGNNPGSGALVNLSILAVNDFHGQIIPGKYVNNSPVGSMGVLASYLLTAINESEENQTIIALPGDITGASTPESGLLLDEPTLLFFNLFSGNTSPRPYHPIASCPIIATVGNHEFDRNLSELIRKIYGGDGNTTITHLQDPYPGSDATFIAANILMKDTGDSFLPPSSVKVVQGVPVAFIGAVTNATPYEVLPDNVKDLTFLDEADAINRQAEALKGQGIHAFVALIHEGGSQTAYEGPTRQDTQVTGRITDIVQRLDSDIDVVLSGHTHEFTNAYLNNSGGRPVLVTQASAYSKAFARVSLTLDPGSGDIVGKTASIITPYADRPPGTYPDPEATRLLNDTLNITGPLVNQVISWTRMNITTSRNADGESNLYDLVTDSMRNAMKTDMAIINEGAVRADISPGNITMGKAYEMLPFGNNIITVNMTGGQVRALLEQQWNRTIRPDHMLQISGLRYTYDDTRPVNNRVLSISLNGSPVRPEGLYSIATYQFLASGGDGYTVMNLAQPGITGPLDVDVLISYLSNQPVPLEINYDGRITRVISGGVNISGIDPDSGAPGETVPVTITGQNFTTGAQVSLHNDGGRFLGERVSAPLPTTLLCSFPIPGSAGAGAYDLTVTNSDGKNGTLFNAFTVRPPLPPEVQSVSPGKIHAGTNAFMVMHGNNFMPGALVRISQDQNIIPGKYPVTANSRTISASFMIPKNSVGSWNLSVTNPDGQTGELIAAFQVLG